MYFRKKSTEDLPHEETAIWSCNTAGCKGWIRDNFAFENLPTCHLCLSPMVSGVRMLPLLANTNKDMKTLKQGTLIS
ncbi:cold-shock protein [Cohnella silvisoli]|uniref:Cold-shock protein n=1 Tax=Cohnella silvisoli TaxID=2873699 RepID=A0ABV1KQL8_9BACL|nr:cold-shock protein [Cohnella silvisoli]MCD9022065.1 cold-shock protein [Cohnella silvisoli]